MQIGEVCQLLDPIFIELDFLNRKLAKISEFY